MKWDIIDERPHRVYARSGDVWMLLMPIQNEDMKKYPSDIYGTPMYYDGEADDLIVWPKPLN